MRKNRHAYVPYIENQSALNGKTVNLWRGEFSEVGTILLSQNITNFNYIEFYWLDVINGYGVHNGKIRSGHSADIVLTAAHGKYVADMVLTMSGTTITIKSSDRYSNQSQSYQGINNIILIEINGIRN